jgi:FolB domain-containing protein
MHDKVIIKDLGLRGVIGIYDWEREVLQEILVNIEVDTDISRAAQEDKIDHCVNYRTISKKVIKYVEEVKPFTVERMAEDVAAMCLEETQAISVKVRVEKPGAVRFSRSVGVEIFRQKA